jgi:hypothetical protein
LAHVICCFPLELLFHFLIITFPYGWLLLLLFALLIFHIARALITFPTNRVLFI